MDGRLIATAALLPYSAGNAWISMVLVTPDFRRRGYRHPADRRLPGRGKQARLTAWLDATPAGAAVYGPLGFTPTLQLRRLCLAAAVPGSTIPLATCDLDELVAAISRRIGFDRLDLIRELTTRAGSRLIANDTAVALVRDGRTARHIWSALYGTSRSCAGAGRRHRRKRDRPAPDRRRRRPEDFLKGLTNNGWTIERPFQRMRLGRATTEPAAFQFAVAGPEYG